MLLKTQFILRNRTFSFIQLSMNEFNKTCHYINYISLISYFSYHYKYSKCILLGIFLKTH